MSDNKSWVPSHNALLPVRTRKTQQPGLARRLLGIRISLENNNKKSAMNKNNQIPQNVVQWNLASNNGYIN